MPSSPLEIRMARLEGVYEQVNQRLASIDARFASIDARFDAIDRKIDERFMWTIGVVLGTWLTTILAVFLHH